MRCDFCLKRECCRRNKANASNCRLYEEDGEVVKKHKEEVEAEYLESRKRLKEKVKMDPRYLEWLKMFGMDTSDLIEEEPTLPIKLKDYPRRHIYAWGYNGLIIRYNNDSKELNLNTLKENPNFEKILESNIISQREFFGTKVLVLDYVENEE